VTDDGSHSIYSKKFGVSYHSSHGAIGESKHIFINAGLKPIVKLQGSVNILEIGFGTGLNAFLTDILAKNLNIKISYVGVEAFPIKKKFISTLNYPELIGEGKYRDDFFSIHNAAWNTETLINSNFKLKKELKYFEDISYTNHFDLVYFDAFDPHAQPELWDTPLLAKIHSSMIKGGVLVTYCAQGQFKRNLKEVGFVIESLPGPIGKREMTRAIA
jgi:tRNA U34 5-methylaminomethyl-2-thiouridine-forming methyltransferase MnmC